MKPILFNTDMVRAILDGRKTQTRRVIKPEPVFVKSVEWNEDDETFDCFCENGLGKWIYAIKPPCRPGDILYVRETWFRFNGQYVYRATAAQPELWDGTGMWSPSIHMPKEAARLFLRVTDVRAERIHEMGEDYARAEGCERGPSSLCPYLSGFIPLWDRTIKPADLPRYGWDANPWVWVIEFERCEKPEEG